MLQLMRFDVNLDKICMKEWLFLYRNDIHERLLGELEGMFRRENFENRAIWCVCVYLLN